MIRRQAMNVTCSPTNIHLKQLEARQEYQPSAMMNSKPEIIIASIRGRFETDSSVDPKSIRPKQPKPRQEYKSTATMISDDKLSSQFVQDFKTITANISDVNQLTSTESIRDPSSCAE
jgi:hypothetical protein